MVDKNYLEKNLIKTSLHEENVLNKLDYNNKKEIIKIFKNIKESNKTIICVTHDKELANSPDRVIDFKKITSVLVFIIILKIIRKSVY